YSSAEFRASTIRSNDYVEKLYQHILVRTSYNDPAAQGWIDALDKGASPLAVAGAILTTAEADAIVVTSLYQTYRHRAPDSAGLQNTVNTLLGGTTYEQLLAAFVASPEYQQSAGGDLNQQYVAQLYQDLLGRAADSSGLQHFTQLLD